MIRLGATIDIGAFTHPITLHSASGDDSETLEALVDTGATFAGIPTPVLDGLGIHPVGTVDLQLANGQVEGRPIGEARAELNGVVRTIICVFSDSEAPPFIGAHTLEGFMLSVDPVKKQLVPVVGYWL